MVVSIKSAPTTPAFTPSPAPPPRILASITNFICSALTPQLNEYCNKNESKIKNTSINEIKITNKYNDAPKNTNDENSTTACVQAPAAVHLHGHVLQGRLHGLGLCLQVLLQHIISREEVAMGCEMLSQAQVRIQGFQLQGTFLRAHPVPLCVHALAVQDLVGRRQEPSCQELVQSTEAPVAMPE